ncbi:MAG: hypothetical protein ACTSQE_02640 [Candidatus Heimdallarchaeaceae archaeon]
MSYYRKKDKLILEPITVPLYLKITMSLLGTVCLIIGLSLSVLAIQYKDDGNPPLLFVLIFVYFLLFIRALHYLFRKRLIIELGKNAIQLQDRSTRRIKETYSIKEIEELKINKKRVWDRFKPQIICEMKIIQLNKNERKILLTDYFKSNREIESKKLILEIKRYCEEYYPEIIKTPFPK